MAERIKDMTQGKPARLILSFALPLMLGSIFQQFYTMVDTMVVGRVVGVEALASLGAADWLNWMVLGIMMGFTQGFSILLSHCYGAEDREGMRRGVAMSVLLTALLAVLLTIVGHLCIHPVLRFLNTPENIIGGALEYLRIIFSGIVVVSAYNLVSSMLRALGDSKTPLYAMVVASVINIALDLLFVAVFHWGIRGAAFATVIAQLASVLFCLRAVRDIELLHTRKADWRVNGGVCGRLIQLGTPMAFQNGIIAVGGLVVQYVINGFGFIFVAGFTATNKLYGLLELAATSFGFSMATFAGQNLGAKKLDRIQTGMRSARRMAIVTAVVISAVMLLLGRPILSLFVSGEPEQVNQVLRVAYTYLAVMSALLFVLYLLHLYRSALQGMGDTVTPMVSGVVELAMRIVAVLLLPRFLGEWGVYLAEVAAWLGAVALLIAAYYRRMNRELARLQRKS